MRLISVDFSAENLCGLDHSDAADDCPGRQDLEAHFCLNNHVRQWQISEKESPVIWAESLDMTGFFGGELGIRTLETFRSTAFRVLHLRPLGQLSVYLMCISCFGKKQDNTQERYEVVKIRSRRISCAVGKVRGRSDLWDRIFRVSPVMTTSIPLHILFRVSFSGPPDYHTTFFYPLQPHISPPQHMNL